MEIILLEIEDGFAFCVHHNHRRADESDANADGALGCLLDGRARLGRDGSLGLLSARGRARKHGQCGECGKAESERSSRSHRSTSLLRWKRKGAGALAARLPAKPV
jgi:hypothetical protein